MVLLDILLSILLPFLAFAAFSWVMLRLVQRTGVSGRALSRAQELGPPTPRTSIIDVKGNVRHEWAVDLEMQRLRRSERQW
jgi:hypothetical protein